MVVLYQNDLAGTGLDELYVNLEKDQGRPVAQYTKLLASGVLDQKQVLDRIIDANSRDWHVSRMGVLERSILRIAVYEIREQDEIAFETSVDEAVAMAKRYCSTEAGSLVNGILGNLKTRPETAAGQD